MTASQMKRIRTKLARAADLTAEAHELAEAGHADYGLREITARAADDMTSAQRALGMYDDRNRANIEAIARSLNEEGTR
jgi:hypothetical protein